MTEKMFPIQGEHIGRTDRPYGQVPWAVAELAYQQYKQWYGDSQSLEHLAERGGFGWTELVCLLRGDKEGMRTPMPATRLTGH